MTTEERGLLIDSYGQAYSFLLEALKEFPKKMWQWRPAPDKWSVHEIIVHIADSEVNSYVRCRRFIAEPGSGVYAYDENKWANKLNYHDQNIEEALELFKLLRKMTYDLIKNLDDNTWKTATVDHSDNGIMQFEDWLRIYEEHVPIHIRQMNRNLAAWKALHAKAV